MKKRVLCFLLLCVLALCAGCHVSPAAEVSSVPAAEPCTLPVPCSHEAWEDGVCVRCGRVCFHPQWEAGTCPVCGLACPHAQWEDGVCAACGTVCSHPAHDPETRACLSCGTPVPHAFLQGQCACGARPEFETEDIPAELFLPCPEPGRVEIISYESRDYGRQARTGEECPILKRMAVYLPYGYDPEEKYDVLVLLHGMGGDEEYWLVEPREYGLESGWEVYTTDMLDNLIYSGYCRPLIVAAPTYYVDTERMWDYVLARDVGIFAQELRQDILPCLAERYATWADSPAEADLVAAREHFGYAGLSLGSIVGFYSVLPQCLDLFAWIGCFSGSEVDPKMVNAGMCTRDFRELSIGYFYNGAGELDSMKADHLEDYRQLVELNPRLTEGENAVFVVESGTFHEFKGWIIDLYNCLQVFFNRQGA